MGYVARNAKTWVLVCLSAIVAVFSLMSCVDQGSDSSTSTKAVDTSANEAAEPPVDEQGRWIVMLGEVELHVPKDTRSQPPDTKPYEIYPAALCLREQDGLADCFDLRDRIRIFLMARPLGTPPPKCNMDRDYSDGALEGPFPTANAEVELFKTASGTTRRYVYRKPGETCRIPTTPCNAVNCIVRFTPHPGVSVRYEFSEDAIGQWPAIHQRVLRHATSFIAKEE